MPFSFQRPKFSKLTQWLRWAYNFDGVDDRGQLAFKAVNIDGDNVFEFYTPPDFNTAYVIVSQNITGIFNQREFQLYTSAGTNGLVVLFGGTASTLYTIAQGLKPSTKYGLRLLIDNTDALIYEGGLDGPLVRQTSFVRGTAREPAATTKLGCNTDNATNVNFFKGVQRDVRINNFFWPLEGKNLGVQLPIPTGLGAEVYTKSVIANPSNPGSQWTYLGDDRWQLTGNGDYNELIFIPVQPRSYVLEFEIESISGGTLRCFSTSAQSSSMSNHLFSTVGRHRFVLTAPVAGAYQSFVRHVGTINCIIKVISLKPLTTVDPTEIIVNGEFSSGASGWTTASGGSLSVSSGQATLTTTSGQGSRFEQGVVLEPLAWYEYSASLISLSGVSFSRIQMLRGAAGAYRQILGVNYTAAGRMSVIFQAPASDGIAQISGDNTNAGTVVVDNVSLRKLSSICNPITLVNTTSDRWQEVS